MKLYSAIKAEIKEIKRDKNLREEYSAVVLFVSVMLVTYALFAFFALQH